MSAANEAWVWLDPQVLLAVHDAQLAEHGGAAGGRSMELFESALARPGNLAACGMPDVAELAASYGVGIARNPPFVDGTERTAFLAVGLFLALNGWRLTGGDADCVMAMLAVAAGELDEAAFAAWLHDRLRAGSLRRLAAGAFVRGSAARPSRFRTACGHEKPRRGGVVGGAADAGQPPDQALRRRRAT